MQLVDIINWYSRFTDTNLNVGLLLHMKKVGMISDDIDLDVLNSFMLSSEDGKYITDSSGRYIVKESRKILNDSFISKTTQTVVKIEKPKSAQQKKPLRFKIEKTGDKTLKLVKNEDGKN